MNGVEFTVDQPDPEVDLKAMTNDSGEEGYISFGGVPTGTYPVMETPQDGYELGAVFCYTAPAPNSIADPPYENYTPSDGSTIEVVLENGYVVTCHWFNVPMNDYTVTVYKWQCEPGTMPDQPLEYYQGGLPDQDTGPCEMQQADVPFTLTHGGPDVASSRRSTAIRSRSSRTRVATSRSRKVTTRATACRSATACR